jgi:hypothetical protein
MADADSTQIPFDGDTVTIAGRAFKLPHRILATACIENGVAVIYDYMEFPQARPAGNLEAFDTAGRRLWTAETLDAPASAYVSFISAHPLKVWNFAGYVCSIDPGSGHLVGSIFTK